MTLVWGNFMYSTPVGLMTRVGGFLGVRLSLVMEWDELSEEALLPYPDRRDSHAPLGQKKKLMAGAPQKQSLPHAQPLSALEWCRIVCGGFLCGSFCDTALSNCLVATEGSFQSDPRSYRRRNNDWQLSVS